MKRWTEYRRQLHENHRRQAGFTLVEMIVAFSILGIALVAIGGLLITGVRSYNSVSAETNVQNEAQIAMTQVQDTIIDASLGVSYNVQVSGTDHFVENDSDAELNGLNPTYKYIYVFNWNTDRSSVEALIMKYDISAKKLYYYEKTGLHKSNNGTTQSIAEAVDVDHISGWELLAEGVDTFSIDMSRYQTTRQILADLTLSKAGKTYNSNVIITLRNDVLINPNNIDDVYDRVDAVINTVITGVDLMVSSYSMVRGGTVQLTTKVLGTGYPSQRIYQWKIEAVDGVSVSKDADGKISVNGEVASNLTTVYDSLSESNSGSAAVDISTKVLSLSAGNTYSLIKVTAIVYAGEDVDHNPVYKSDSEYIAIKEISNFTIQPDDTSKTKYTDNNSGLEVPNNGFPAASYAQSIGTTVPSSGEANPDNSMDVYPNNIIDIKATLTGTNLDDSDKGIIWSVHSTSAVGNVSISNSGVLTINRYAQQGWAIISACPVLDSSMILYYMVRIGNEYATTNNALSIGGPDTVNRGGSAQMTLKLNGHEMSRLEDFNWTYKIYDSANRLITDTTTSLTTGGLLTAGTTLSYDYGFNIEISASMKSNPDVKATKTISVPRVTLTMTEPTLITKRGNLIPEGSTRCVVTGLETFDLVWTLASQTNPSYYNSSLPNGSWISNAGDTCSINISGSEPQTLTYMRARATLSGYSNYYAETYLSLADVSLSVEGDGSVNRGGSVILIAKLNPADAGISTANTNWSIISVKNSRGTEISQNGLSLSVEKGAYTSLNVGSNFIRSDSEVKVTVQAVLNGITATKTVIIEPTEEFTITYDKTVKRGGTANVDSNYGSEVIWSITKVSAGDKDQLTLTTNADGKCTVNVPVYFDTSNGDDTLITITGQVDGTDISKSCQIRVTKVELSDITASKNASNKNLYDCSTTVKGLNNASDCTINWALSSSNNKNARGTQASNIVFKNNNYTGSPVMVDISGKNQSLKEIWVVAYLTVKNAAGQTVELSNTAVSAKITLTSLKTLSEVSGLSYEGADLRCYVDKKNNWSGWYGTKYHYLVEGYAAYYTYDSVQYYKVKTYSRTDGSGFSVRYPSSGWVYLAKTGDGVWYYLNSASSDKDWHDVSGASVNEVFGFTPDKNKTSVNDILSKMESALKQYNDSYWGVGPFSEYID